jgi:hypothetical protein
MHHTYVVSTWDHDEQRWAIRACGLTLWGLRPLIRQLYGEGWDIVSIFVEREVC